LRTRHRKCNCVTDYRIRPIENCNTHDIGSVLEEQLCNTLYITEAVPSL